jgi:two-component system chemotaxis response regulator CheB
MSIGALAGKLAFHIKAAHAAKKRFRPAASAPVARTVPQGLAPVAMLGRHDKRLIVVGASTGGVEALSQLLPGLPTGLPPILVVQHIPAFFSKAVADRLNQLCGYEVREAVHDEPILPGQCLMAPGNFHLLVAGVPGSYRTRLVQSPPVHYCRPAVDLLFRSAAELAGKHTLAVLLTGMGSDGALGMQAVRRAGGINLAEHEDSCVIYGMPRAAVQLGVVDKSVPIERMPQAVMEHLNLVGA